MKHAKTTSRTISAVLVFRQKVKPWDIRCVYVDQAREFDADPDWRHLATLEPAIWIEFLLNSQERRDAHIDGVLKA